MSLAAQLCGRQKILTAVLQQVMLYKASPATPLSLKFHTCFQFQSLTRPLFLFVTESCWLKSFKAAAFQNAINQHGIINNQLLNTLITAKETKTTALTTCKNVRNAFRLEKKYPSIIKFQRRGFQTTRLKNLYQDVQVVREVHSGRPRLSTPHKVSRSTITPTAKTTQLPFNSGSKSTKNIIVKAKNTEQGERLRFTPPAKGKRSPFDQAIEGITTQLVPEMRQQAVKAAARAVLSIRSSGATEDERNTQDDIEGESTVPLRRLFGLVRDEFPRLTAAMLAVFISSVSSLAFPTTVGKVIDMVQQQGNSSEVELLLLGMMGLVGVGSIAVFVRVSLLAIVSEQVARRTRKRVFHCLINQRMSFFDYNDTGRLVNRLNTDTSMVAATLTDNVARTLKSLMSSLTSTAMLYSISPQLTLLTLSILPIIGATALIYGEYRKRLTKRYLTRLAIENQVSTERLYGIRTVRSFSCEDREYQRYSDAVDASFLLARKMGIAQGAFLAGGFLIAQGTLLAVLWSGSDFMVTGLITVGKLTSFSMYTAYMYVSVGQVSIAISEFMKAQGAARRVFTVIDDSNQEGLSNPKGLILSKGFSEKLIFNNVSFSYPTRKKDQVLQGLNLTIEPGTSLAIAGISGSGKSTIGLLLSRYYNPTGGSITLGGINIESLDPNWLRRQIAEVSQEALLFSGSISDNIAYGNPSATQEQIEHAAELANAHRFITQLPNGYKTDVGEKGKNLSGGQKQRITIARALLMDAPIMVLDEATSALDAESEYCVIEALKTAMKRRTTIIFSHHMAVLKNADCVAVLRDGAIVEQGPFDDLVRQGGVFSRMVLRSGSESPPRKPRKYEL